MPKARIATPVTLSREQRRELERLWFIYGNYGPKQTPGNHSFIQGLLEHGVDLRPLFTKRTGKAERPTAECEHVVDAVLASSEDDTEETEAQHRPGKVLSVVKSIVQELQPVDKELEALIDDMQRRQRLMREQSEAEDDTPDAA
jgi:hypothetical protein